MPQPVKLSDSLIEAAREAAPAAHRSLAAQVEHWATLGRAIEGSLTSDESAILKGNVVREPAARPYLRGAAADPAHVLAAALERAVSPEFAAQVRASLGKLEGPKYGTHPDYPGYLVRHNADGTLTPGRMVKRKFVAARGGAAGHDASFLLRGEQVTKARVSWPDAPLSAAAARRKKRGARSTKPAST